MATLRSYIFIDQLQPRTMSYLSCIVRGFLPRSEMSAVIIEVAPGLAVEGLLDIALKKVDVRPGILVVERHFGYLELHSHSTASVQTAAAEILSEMGASEADAMKPEITASTIITRVDPYHSFMINRNRSGYLCLPGETVFVLECAPAAYAILAANEAEKAADVKIIECRLMGAAGRLYLSGTDSDIRMAASAAEDVLRRLAE
jgi:ethanolamine utilization microcompartment shell protein EutS